MRTVALVYLVALGAVVVLAIASVQARAGDVRAPGPYACGLGPCRQPPMRKPQ